nr:unnamed protein product [Spirometra erinaceieuropaei]
METNRKVLGRQRLLESLIRQQDHQIRSGEEFRNLNVQLLDNDFRNQLTSFLTCLGGHNVDEFVKRIFFAIFDDEISLCVNFKGRKTKERLSGSKLYEVILEVFGAWNTDRSVKLSDLESALTKRLKRSLDSYVQRKNKSQVHRDEIDNIPGPSSNSPPA